MPAKHCSDLPGLPAALHSLPCHGSTGICCAAEELAGGQQGRALYSHPSWPLNRRSEREQSGSLPSGDVSAQGYRKCASAPQKESPQKSCCSRMVVSSFCRLSEAELLLSTDRLPGHWL